MYYNGLYLNSHFLVTYYFGRYLGIYSYMCIRYFDKNVGLYKSLLIVFLNLTH